MSTEQRERSLKKTSDVIIFLLENIADSSEISDFYYILVELHPHNPERLVAPSLTSVCTPIGIAAISSAKPAIRAASQPSSIDR
uniref:hypothetical protein n=1 Tax=Scytonema sp. HK-05 TaxID=1137095 RepID=UPI000A8F2239|nr:hypothetical protein [Scytonema sp. HK-05]